MDRITFTREPVGFFVAKIVEELPRIGDEYKLQPFLNHTVLEVAPFLPTGRQDNPEVFNYAYWKVHLSGKQYDYLAIHEEQAEHI